MADNKKSGRTSKDKQKNEEVSQATLDEYGPSFYSEISRKANDTTQKKNQKEEDYEDETT